MNNEIFIGLLGQRNQGKSSIMNIITGQDVSIVSEIPGTTTDPVKKSIELFGLGRCIVVDTAGFDDEGEVGGKRKEKTAQSLNLLSVALVIFSSNNFTSMDADMCSKLSEKNIPFILLHNKKDIETLSDSTIKSLAKLYPNSPIIDFSAQEKPTESEFAFLVDTIKSVLKPIRSSFVSPLDGIVKKDDIVLLVTPIDSQAPEGRLILPQVQIARQCLDLHAVCVLCQVEELQSCLKSLSKAPTLVITDSQAFAEVKDILPEEQALTSFSICMAKQKGPFSIYKEGTKYIPKLKDGDKVLLLESCTHQVNCQDIGRVKLPNLLKTKTGKNLEFVFIAGADPIPENLKDYAMIIQCGGCVVTAKQLENRLAPFLKAGIPVSNYGMTLSFLQGIFDRAISPFESICNR